ncbi:hypothetical protein [Winogradskyella undariae]|uniref:hypothetical protein n=1 Tax=Winogradskyella undariae TaxID=1285465 RepID=UPI0015C894F9|nr:hypothetical protein [Winogradskyella undariae]
MKKIILILFTLFLTLNIQAQRSRRSSMGGVPQTNNEPTDKEIAKREREMEERKEEYIDNFLSTLEADDFQKHIIKQNINSYFDEKIAVLKTPFEHSLDREEAIKKLEDTHFIELKELISENDMAKLMEMIKGGFNEKEVVKEKKKRRKRKNKKNEDD